MRGTCTAARNCSARSKSRALTVRTSIIGRELERASGLLDWFAAQAGEEVSGFRKAIFSGLTTARSPSPGRVARAIPSFAVSTTSPPSRSTSSSYST